jgi:hypothetical protein
MLNGALIVFYNALELPEGERDRFVDEACDRDVSLIRLTDERLSPNASIASAVDGISFAFGSYWDVEALRRGQGFLVFVNGQKLVGSRLPGRSDV